MAEVEVEVEVEVAEEAEMTGRASLAGTWKRLDAADSVINVRTLTTYPWTPSGR